MSVVNTRRLKRNIVVNVFIQQCETIEVTLTYRPYAHDVISVGRPHLEVKRRLFIGQYCAPRIQIRASRLFRHRFSSKMAAG